MLTLKFIFHVFVKNTNFKLCALDIMFNLIIKKEKRV